MKSDYEKWNYPDDGEEIRFRIGEQIPGSPWHSKRDKRTGEVVLTYSYYDDYEIGMLDNFENVLCG